MEYCIQKFMGQKRLILWILLTLFLTATTVAILILTHQKEHTQATWTTQDLSKSYAQLTAHLLDDASEILTNTAQNWIDGAANLEQIQALYKHRIETNPYLMDLLLLDPKGAIVAWSGEGTPPDVTDRTYYRIHLEHKEQRVHLSPATLSRVHEGLWFFSLSLCLWDEQGQIEAIGVAIISLQTMEGHYKRLLTDPAISAALLDENGRFILRIPAIARPLRGEIAPSVHNLNLPLEETTTLQPSEAVDRKRRLVTLQPVENYPLMTSATLDLDIVMAPWRQLVVVLAGLWLFAIGLSWWALGWLLRLLTERQQAQEGLADQLSLQQILFEEVDDAIVIFDERGLILLANPAAHHLYGYPQGDLLRRPGHILVDPDYRVLFDRFLNLKSGETFEAESLDRRRDGSTFYSEIKGRTIVQNGQNRLLAVVRDISDRKNKEAQARTRHNLDTLLREIATRLISCQSSDLDSEIEEALGQTGRFAQADRSYLFRVTRQGYVSNTHEWCSPETTPQKEHLQNIPQETMPWWMQKINAKEVIRLNTLSDLPTEAKNEHELLTQQEIRSLLAIPLELDGEVVGFLGLDMTRQRHNWSDEDVTAMQILSTLFSGAIDRARREEQVIRSEIRFRIAADKSGQLIYEYDPENGHIEWAGAITQITGYTPEAFAATDINGWAQMIHSADRDRVMDIFFQAESFSGIFDAEYRLLRQDGSYRYVEEHGSFYNDAQGHRRMIGAINDITNRVLAYQDLEVQVHREVQKRLQTEKEKHDQERLLIQQSKMAAMGEMIGAIAHQWRQPLNALGLFIQDLKDAWSHNELDGPYLDRIVAQSMRQIGFMSKTIDDFKHFFKPNKNPRPFSIPDAIKSVEGLVSAQLKDHQIALLTRLPTEALPLILGHESEFEQVLLNLISNAKDALIDRAIARPQILIECQQSEDKTLVLWVEDNAGGIPAEIIDRIFEPYYTTKEEGKGTGIGLYMSKMIVEESMKGSLMATNTPQGARMVVTLPLKPYDEA